MRDIDYGTVRIKLNELIEQQGISKNRLAHCIRPLSAAIRAAFSGQTGPY